MFAFPPDPDPLSEEDGTADGTVETAGAADATGCSVTVAAGFGAAGVVVGVMGATLATGRSVTDATGAGVAGSAVGAAGANGAIETPGCSVIPDSTDSAKLVWAGAWAGGAGPVSSLGSYLANSAQQAAKSII